jgi:lipopolysaccharide export system permease protein
MMTCIIPFIIWLQQLPWHRLAPLKKLNPLRYVKRMDRYIIYKFIGTYFYSILLIISISIVFDVNENLAKFTNYHAPLRAIVFDYYANFVPYFANLFSPLFVFIAVIFFTSKLAGNSEIIAMLACGMSFKRLLRPYIISAALIALLNFYLGSYIIPKGTVIRHDFESLYKNNTKNTSASNIQLMVDKGVVAYLSQYDDIKKTGYGFALYKFENKKMVSQMNASVVQYDTIAEER